MDGCKTRRHRQISGAVQSVGEVMRRVVVVMGLAGLGLLVAWLGLAYLGLWPWSIPQPTLRATLGEDDPTELSCLAFSPDGRMLAAGSSSDGKIKLWNVDSGQNTTTLQGQDAAVHSVVFSPDGKSLAAGVTVKGGGTAIMLWDMTTGKEKVAFKGAGARSVAFSPDGKSLASGSIDETIRVWDVASGKNTSTLKAWGTVSVAFSPDGKLLASASIDGTVKLWDLASGNIEPDCKWEIGPGGSADSVAFSPDGKALAAGGATDMPSMSICGAGGGIMLWDLTTRNEKVPIRAGDKCHDIHSVAFSPDGKHLASGSCDGKVQLWDTSTGKLRTTLRYHYKEIRAVVFSPNGKILAAGGESGQIKLWDMPDAK